jgi:cell division protein FtsI/penicillin-binding protein 2
MAAYPPGSIFKPILALIAMQEGVLYPKRTIYCNGGYHYKQLSVGCHGHPTATDVSSALQHSCNAYFVQVFRDLIEQEGFSNPARGLEKMDAYLADFGLGAPLGIDLPQEKSLATKNAAESLLSRTRHVTRNVKRWRGGQMMLRWVAAGVLEAAQGFRRLKGHGDMPSLVAALRARDQRIGLGVSVEDVA